MKKLLSREFIIGISVIAALVILFFGIDYLKGINLFKPANFYYVEYDNVAGLEVAAPVQVNGYKVGQVREINFPYDRPGKIQVLLALNKELKLADNSRAVIESSLLSGAYITIKLGDSGKILAVGDTLAGVEGGDLMATLSNDVVPSVGPILVKVDSLLNSLNRVLGDPALVQSVQRLDGISDNLLGASGALNSTLSSDVPALIGSTQGVVKNVDRISYNLDTITRDLTVLSAQLKRLPLEPTMENVRAITANLEEFSNNLNNPNSTLGRLMNDPELYTRLMSISANVDSLIVDIKRNPKRYISIKLL